MAAAADSVDSANITRLPQPAPGSGSRVLGIDLGTSSCKVALVDAAGTVLASADAAYPTASPQPGWAEQQPADWLAAITKAVRAVLAASATPPAAIAGMALTSAAHIGVLLDADGAPVRPAILWQDQRTVAEVADLERRAGADILAASCQAVSPGWTLPHLLWVQRHDPAAWARCRRVCLSKDYAITWLTGRDATDPGTAVSAQLYDVPSAAWSPRLCALAGITPDMLPTVRAADATVGGLTATAAAALGLAAGTPVVNGTLDSATELLAAGICAPGEALVRLATAGGVQLVVAGPEPSRQRITYPHPVAPAWYCQAGTSTCAAAVGWALATLGETGMGFAEWDALAATAPAGAGGVLFHPYLAGERAPHWDPQLRASFVGLGLHHDRSHLARAVYEGAAFSIRQAMAVLPTAVAGDATAQDAAASAAPLAVVGGGAKSALWLGIVATVLGRPLRVADGADSATGAALLGVVGLGLAPDLPTLCRARAAAARVVAPDPAQAAVYAAAYARYVEVHRRLAPFYAG